MIWLPRADQPLVFASPTSISFGFVRRGQARTLRVRLTDAGGGAGAWQVSIRRLTEAARRDALDVLERRRPRPRGAARVRLGARVRGRLDRLRRAEARQRRAADPVLAARLRARSSRGSRTSGCPGRASTTATRAAGGRSSPSYRYPDQPRALGIPVRLTGPEQVFRFVLHRAGRQRGRGHPLAGPRPEGQRLAPPRPCGRRGPDRRLHGPSAPDQSRTRRASSAREPAVGVFRPSPGAYDLVFDTPNGRAPGPFTFRFWVNDTTPPTVRLLSRSVRKVGGSRWSSATVAPGSTRSRCSRWSTGTTARSSTGRRPDGSRSCSARNVTRGRHRLVFSVAD